MPWLRGLPWSTGIPLNTQLTWNDLFVEHGDCLAHWKTLGVSDAVYAAKGSIMARHVTWPFVKTLTTCYYNHQKLRDDSLTDDIFTPKLKSHFFGQRRTSFGAVVTFWRRDTSVKTYRDLHGRSSVYSRTGIGPNIVIFRCDAIKSERSLCSAVEWTVDVLMVFDTTNHSSVSSRPKTLNSWPHILVQTGDQNLRQKKTTTRSTGWRRKKTRHWPLWA